MFASKIASETFGVHPVARAMLALLSGREPDFLPYDSNVCRYKGTLHTRPVYNGRESGIAVIAEREYKIDPDVNTFFQNRGKVFCIVFFSENRNSDNIFVQTVYTTTLTDEYNIVVTTKDLTDKSYYGRKMFGYSQLVEATQAVIDELAAFHQLTENDLRACA